MELALSLDPTTLRPCVPAAGLGPSAAAGVRALTERLKKGDETAWGEFHAAYAPRLLRYLFVVTGGREETVQEALQQTFLRAVRHVRAFDEEEALWCWLTVLARSACTDELRRQTRRMGLISRWWHSRVREDSVNVDAGRDEGFILRQLDQALCDLPEIDRDLLTRKYLRGESVREIATDCRVTERAVESRLGRARAQLRVRLLKRLKHEP